MSNRPTTGWCQDSLIMLKQWPTDLSERLGSVRTASLSRIPPIIFDMLRCRARLSARALQKCAFRRLNVRGCNFGLCRRAAAYGDAITVPL